jgi:GrpB-like predicted nucleotidyltransferase (UPF0157 family)
VQQVSGTLSHVDGNLVWSDPLLDEAQRIRDEVARALTDMGVAGELVLTGATSTPGALTKGDVELHLRVGPASFEDVVERLSRVYEVASPQSWAATLAVFDLCRARPTGLAVTPVGSEHDLRFTRTWQALRGSPELLHEYNALKRRTSDTDRYEEAKSAFFTSISETAGRRGRPSACASQNTPRLCS